MTLGSRIIKLVDLLQDMLIENNIKQFKADITTENTGSKPTRKKS